ncbi:MAG TPA: hypothetical protein VIM11_00730 [Tepidisphaeraceae bacterium]|jgi:hypothetical protein
MDRPLKKIAFVLEDCSLGSPGQQLLDRVLIGYPRDGEFHRCEGEVHVYLAPQAADAELRRRLADFPLHRESTIEQAVTGADGIVVVPGHVHSAALAKSCLAAAPGGSAVFVYGAIAGDLSDAQNLVSLAESRKVPFAAGTSLAVTWRLPDVDVPAGAPVKRALIVVQGESPLAELHALDGLLPLLERRKNGERGVRSVRSFTGDATWAAGDEWVPRRLLAAALSRSDSPQGDPVRDGRTQDLLGLGLVPGLARSPRAWVIDHTDDVRSTILVLDGVIADFNFAVELANGSIVSAQLYRPPAPQRHEFSRLAAVIERFFVSRKSPWLPRRSVLTSGLLGAFARAGRETGSIRTPELAV